MVSAHRWLLGGRESGVQGCLDVLLVVAREYNENPVLMSLLPAAMLSARRRKVLSSNRVYSAARARYRRRSIPRHARLAALDFGLCYLGYRHAVERPRSARA